MWYKFYIINNEHYSLYHTAVEKRDDIEAQISYQSLYLNPVQYIHYKQGDTQEIISIV